MVLFGYFSDKKKSKMANIMLDGFSFGMISNLPASKVRVFFQMTANFE